MSIIKVPTIVLLHLSIFTIYLPLDLATFQRLSKGSYHSDTFGESESDEISGIGIMTDHIDDVEVETDHTEDIEDFGIFIIGRICTIVIPLFIVITL